MFEAISQGGIEFDGVDNAAKPVAQSNANSEASGKPVEHAEAPAVRSDNETVGSLLDVFA